MNCQSLVRGALAVSLLAATVSLVTSANAQNLPTRTQENTARPAGNTYAAALATPAYEFRTDPPATDGRAETVDVHDLAIPPKALKEFERGTKAFESGDAREAASHLEKALKIAPDFVQAHNNLGAMYINLRDYHKAALELQKTINLDAKLKSPYHNLAMLMIFLGRLPEAENAARHVLELDTDCDVSRYWLGRILVMERKDAPEAEQLLMKAAPQVPESMLWLAQILQNRGEIGTAIAELHAYLQVSAPDKRAKVETWLSQLSKEAANKAAPPCKEDAGT